MADIAFEVCQKRMSHLEGGQSQMSSSLLVTDKDCRVERASLGHVV